MEVFLARVEKKKAPKRDGLEAFSGTWELRIAARIQHPRASQSVKAFATALLPET
jgi:hypothetical protein